MSRTKEIATAVGTLACALGIGFAMQNTDTASQRYGDAADQSPEDAGAVEAEPQAQAVPKPAPLQVAVLNVQDVTLTSAMPSSLLPAEPALIEDASRETPPPVPYEAERADEATEQAVEPETVDGPDCTITATATPANAATVALTLAAPCHANMRVTVHHNGMFFTERTDADGALARTVPGLSEQAVYIFAFSDGDGAVVQTTVPDVANYNRVVLQWRGPAGFELHARAFGAAYGEAGHVWSGAEDLDIAKLETGTGGYIHSLGNADVAEPQQAEVYSYPVALSGRNGEIDLSVEAEITSQNCGLEIEAQTLERDGSGTIRAQNLTLAVPGCEIIGDYLVLNTVLDDMKIAAR